MSEDKNKGSMRDTFTRGVGLECRGSLTVAAIGTRGDYVLPNPMAMCCPLVEEENEHICLFEKHWKLLSGLIGRWPSGRPRRVALYP